MKNVIVGLATALMALGSVGCGTSETTDDGDGGTRTADGSAVNTDGGEGAADGSSGLTDWFGDGSVFDVNDAGQVLCGSEPCQCSNGIDDDDDGQMDGLDAECTGPADDDESSFATGIPGDNRDPYCQDCFFDGNSGSGNDKCYYATSCLTDGDPSSGNGICGRSCEVSETCVNNCRPYTPNGCDCFGCCELQIGSGMAVNVLIGGTCSLETATDTEACPRCEPDTKCVNTCGECELCPGRTTADLPAKCSDTPGDYDHTCDNGEQPCNSSGDCDNGYACLQGCCLPPILL